MGSTSTEEAAAKPSLIRKINSRTSLPSWRSVFSVNSPVSVSTMAMVCCFACRSHPRIFISASFVPSLFGWNRKVYSGRREADLVMSSVKYFYPAGEPGDDQRRDTARALLLSGTGPKRPPRSLKNAHNSTDEAANRAYPGQKPEGHPQKPLKQHNFR